MNSNINLFKKYEELLHLISEEPNYRNYWNVYKRIKKLDFSNINLPPEKQIKIALLSSFTIDPIATYLDIDCRLEGLFPQIYIAPFNRYQEEVINSQSELYKFNPDIIIFFVELESILGDNFRVKFPHMNKEDKLREINKIITIIEQLLSMVSRQTNALVLFSNFIIPTFSPFGILDNKQEIGLKKFYKIINDKLEDLYQTNKQIFIINFDEVASRFGKNSYFNFLMYYRGALLLNDLFIPNISYELMGYVKSFKLKIRKCIVLDLDNTLWGGIIGEDGIEGIKLNINYPGNEYVDFQRSLLSLHNRGIILAINSKNNYQDAFEVIQNHPHMLIKEKNLAAYRINWNDKVQNMIDLAKEINIGLDSLVFFDDNPVERARIQTALPDVKVVDLPSSSALYRKTLENLNDFNTLSLTQEDLHRSEMYYARRKRKDLQDKIQSIDEFIESLDLTIEIKEINDFSLPRVVSLLNRTNQFNLTTKRYNENEIKHMVKELKTYLIYTLQVYDKFGDEGIVGVSIIHKKSSNDWFIDCFLMSCRVIGRKIESSFLLKIIKEAQRNHVGIIEAEYIPTRKNSLVKNFYSDHGFSLKYEDEKGNSSWVLDVNSIKKEYPDYIKIVE